MFEHEWTVRFSDTDPFGIAFYPDIVNTVHETADVFMQDIGFPLWELSQDHGIGLPIAEIDLSFSQPLRAGDVVRITLTTEVGRQSVRFDYVGECDGVKAFSGFEQRVCVPVGGDSAIELPEDLRTAMERGGDG
ncbi:acyl-CoA thioesterase [Halococcus sp. AFM35]|uniref:acyl-CoA thioesterase n=1 Tax=Halococcus sp. AFM35 TaxID=3421653 RepID=UPI003EC0D895